MKAALKVIESLDGYSRKWLVLGDMLELGEAAESYHREIGKVVNSIAIQGLFTVGNWAHFITGEASTSKDRNRIIKHFDNKSALTGELESHLQPGDLVLFKGSRGIELDTILQKLI